MPHIHKVLEIVLRQVIYSLTENAIQIISNISDYNEAATYSGKSGAFTTFIHEILHSLGHKHPFDPIDASDSSEGNANIYQNEFEQYPYTVMSYTPMRDKATL